MQVGSCDISELVLVGQGRPDAGSGFAYSSILNAANATIPGAGSFINGMYGALGIDPVGRPNVYACPRDFEAIIVDRRTGWELEKRLGMIAAALLIVFVALNFYKK
jgi:hypothetical protein